MTANSSLLRPISRVSMVTVGAGWDQWWRWRGIEASGLTGFQTVGAPDASASQDEGGT